MRLTKLHELSVTDLVARFEQIALEQDQALLMDEVARYNTLYDQMDAVKNELKSRPGDQRRALLVLYDHPNGQVRLKAAIGTLAVAPESARESLQSIADSHEYPEAAEAGMTLWDLDRGTFKPT
jgi:Domain of unknown function (DUF2019)